MTCISLFSGIGGFDLGFQRAGIEIIEQVEINKECKRLLANRFPEAQLHEDITKYEPTRTPDIICGGFPCQDLSVAGRRAGLAGERSGLFYEFMRIVGATNPKYVVLENVPGLLSSNAGRDMGTVVWDLAKIGYSVAWRVLDAQYFGLAQRRKRVFIVGCSSARRAAEILLEPEGLPGDTPPSREKRQEVTECAGTLSANGGGTNRPAGNANELDFCVAHQVTRSSGIKGADHETYIAATVGGGNYGAGNLDEGIPNMVWDKTNITSKTNRTRLNYDQCNTLHSGELMVGVRRLTPVECERLQGFPDGWTDGFADSVRYRMLGNAVAVLVAEWIGRRIVTCEKNNTADNGEEKK